MAPVPTDLANIYKRVYVPIMESVFTYGKRLSDRSLTSVTDRGKCGHNGILCPERELGGGWGGGGVVVGIGGHWDSRVLQGRR